MPDFNMVVIGAGGGPNENDLSSYIVKTSSARWEDGSLCLDAGSGLGALAGILTQHPRLFGSDHGHKTDVPESPQQAAVDVYYSISAFIISHGHLDHVTSLVLAAGSQSGPSKRIYALPTTIRVLETVFNGLIWPKLAMHERGTVPKSFYLYEPMSPQDGYTQVSPGISARVMPVTHGICSHSVDRAYESSAWFIRNDKTGSEFLYFGDVEPDSISNNPRTRQVWRAAAPKIKSGKLHTIFLECSWRSDRPNAMLFGHLSPPHVLEELRNLATEIRTYDGKSEPAIQPPPSLFVSILAALGFGPKAPPPPPPLPDSQLLGSLKDIRLVVTHCKSTPEIFPDGATIADVICDEIRCLTNAAGLGITIFAAKQGDAIDI
ncbi:3',5'-cyclic-nucleotide phosphodiesterase pde1 [Tulasnella sp. JGI-2019a]|nr:3',5'-cyclic-nucleotide phosphodiesterase pde1 [Tulasnella sp. JGI-2019a]